MLFWRVKHIRRKVFCENSPVFLDINEKSEVVHLC